VCLVDFCGGLDRVNWVGDWCAIFRTLNKMSEARSVENDLYAAALRGQLAVLRYMLHDKHNVLCGNYAIWRTLHPVDLRISLRVAIRHNHMDVVRYLFDEIGVKLDRRGYGYFCTDLHPDMTHYLMTVQRFDVAQLGPVAIRACYACYAPTTVENALRAWDLYRVRGKNVAIAALRGISPTAWQETHAAVRDLNATLAQYMPQQLANIIISYLTPAVGDGTAPLAEITAAFYSSKSADELVVERNPRVGRD
jgi:hypothetical protein